MFKENKFVTCTRFAPNRRKLFLLAAIFCDNNYLSRFVLFSLLSQSGPFVFYVDKRVF